MWPHITAFEYQVGTWTLVLHINGLVLKLNYCNNVDIVILVETHGYSDKIITHLVAKNMAIYFPKYLLHLSFID
jgi:hypothetical protein